MFYTFIKLYFPINIWETLCELASSSKDVTFHQMEICVVRNWEISVTGKSTNSLAELIECSAYFYFGLCQIPYMKQVLLTENCFQGGQDQLVILLTFVVRLAGCAEFLSHLLGKFY